jgi:hypothetical protein
MFVYNRKCLMTLTLLLSLAAATHAQSLPKVTIVPLTVDKGVPLQIKLTEKVPYKKGRVVVGRLDEPVYAFDRVVIPAGTKVVGKITEFEKGSALKRAVTMLGGDFTPVREPVIRFDTLLFSDGTELPIETVVVPGDDKLVLTDSDSRHSSKGLKSALMSNVQGPAKSGLKGLLWGLSPYHPQWLPAGTPLKAALLSPLDFGEVAIGPSALEKVGSQPPDGAIANARLITPLDSQTTIPGTAVEALLTVPVFSPEHHLLFPAGSKLSGTVLDVTAARKPHHDGKMSLSFSTLELPVEFDLPAQPARSVQGSLAGVHVPSAVSGLHVDNQGNAWISKPKMMSFIDPAIAGVSAGTSVNASANSFGHALVGAYGHKFLKQFGDNSPSISFGIAGGISGAMIPPLGMSLGFFSAARAVYSHFIAKGQDVVFPMNTPMEIRLDSTSPEGASGQ